jgi:hypothetical protein
MALSNKKRGCLPISQVHTSSSEWDLPSATLLPPPGGTGLPREFTPTLGTSVMEFPASEPHCKQTTL